MRSVATRPLIHCIAAATLLWSAVSQGQALESRTEPHGTTRQDTGIRAAAPSENYCLGGIEDRKIIVHESRVTNPFHQTTLLGCQVDGGDPQVMPDLPAPSPIQEVMS